MIYSEFFYDRRRQDFWKIGSWFTPGNALLIFHPAGLEQAVGQYTTFPIPLTDIKNPCRRRS